jgi:hypothetical protein
MGIRVPAYKTLQKTFRLQIVKRAKEVSSGLRRMRKWILWRGRPPPKCKKKLQGVTTGNVGAPATPRVTAPTVVCMREKEREREKKYLNECVVRNCKGEKIFWMILTTIMNENVSANCSGRAGLRREWIHGMENDCRGRSRATGN